MAHDIYNPWHGCYKISEGCANCYMYFLDKKKDVSERSGTVTKNVTSFRYPLQKFRDGTYKIRPGERIRVCMTSDFFLPEADEWRPDVWDMLRYRSDVVWWLLTKRPERFAECLPKDWNDGWENVTLGVTAENQKRADERIPILLSTPAKHRHVCCAPIIGPVNIRKYLDNGLIDEVSAGGENYDGCRTCREDWIDMLYHHCRNADVTFCFYETGTKFQTKGKDYWIPTKTEQSIQAYRSGYQYVSPNRRPFRLLMPDGSEIPDGIRWKKSCHNSHCRECANQFMCNGCCDCGNCCCH